MQHREKEGMCLWEPVCPAADGLFCCEDKDRFRPQTVRNSCAKYAVGAEGCQRVITERLWLFGEQNDEKTEGYMGNNRENFGELHSL